MEDKREEEVKEKVDRFVELCLRGYKGDLGFTYEKVTVKSCEYYGPDDYNVELLFHGYNGGKYPHRCQIYCMHGNNSQTMFLDMGFPSAALSFDRVSIPGEIVKELAKAAYYDTEFAKVREKGKENPTK